MTNKTKKKKLLQVYIDPTLHRAFQQYCLDNDTKNAPVVRKLLTSFLEKQGYLERTEK
jgi:hypothetical protein